MKLQEILNTPVMSFADTIRGEQPTGYRRFIADAIVCKDGTTLSVQASEGHYCEPRNNQGPWYAVEVGYPSAKPPIKWEKFCDGVDVYARVPVTEVKAFINQHGGEA